MQIYGIHCKSPLIIRIYDKVATYWRLFNFGQKITIKKKNLKFLLKFIFDSILKIVDFN